MTAPMTIIDFNKVLQEVAIDLFQTIQSIQECDTNWTRAYLEVRSPQEGGRLIKFRIEMSDGTTDASHDVSEKVSSLLRDAWSIKDQVFPDRWYGLKLILLPTGSCELLFDYNPACASDPTFFEN